MAAAAWSANGVKIVRGSHGHSKSLTNTRTPRGRQAGRLSPGRGTMTRVTISEARRRLPQLVRQVKQDRGSVVQITVRHEVVAELRAALPEPEPGAAARVLLELMRKLPKHRGRRRHISGHVKEYLYGRKRKA